MIYLRRSYDILQSDFSACLESDQDYKLDDISDGIQPNEILLQLFGYP